MKASVNTKSKETVQSEMISFLRFPLIALVVCIHCGIFANDIDSRFTSAAIFVIKDVLARVAVPALFFISGFLFFHNTTFSFSAYVQKNKRRIRTLLVPYLIWNFALLLAMTIFQQEKVFAGCSNFVDRAVVVLSAFWDYHGNNSPISGPLWYLKDLMLLNVLSPVIYLLVKFKPVGQILVCACFIVWVVFGDSEVNRINLAPIAFYSFGAFLSVNHFNLAELIGKTGKLPYVYVALILVEPLLINVPHYNYYHNLILLFGILFIFKIAWLVVRREEHSASAFFSGASFFVYLVHDPWCLAVTKRATCFIVNNGDTAYFICAILTILLALALYYVIKRFIPGFVSILVGSR